VFLLVTLAIFSANDVTFSLYIFQVFYYFVALCFFLLGISWIVSALNVFHRDIGQGLTVILNLWFWLTPIVWTVDIVPEKYRWLLQLNPLEYIVEGYRKSLLYHQPIWGNITGGVYYWLTAAVVFVAGALLFRRLKPEFADVL
jgi:lipopolysaccharide transport system permease protein/teichoic acid transport system permease protein